MYQTALQRTPSPSLEKTRSGYGTYDARSDTLQDVLSQASPDRSLSVLTKFIPGGHPKSSTRGPLKFLTAPDLNSADHGTAGSLC